MRGQKHVVPLAPLTAGDARCETIDELPRFWQARFYDFNMYSHEKKDEKLDYMHANPVNGGLVRHPQDWPWS